MAEEWFNKISHIVKSHDPENPTIDSMLYMLNNLYERKSKLEIENVELKRKLEEILTCKNDE